MKTRRIVNAFWALLAIAVLTLGISASTGVNPLVVGGVLTALSFIPSGSGAVAYDGLNKEIWLPEIMEGFYADDMFLSEARDLSAFVENDKINLAEAGVDPNVIINNTTFPVPTAERADSPLAIELDMYDTENTLIRNADTIELSYDKRASVLMGHRKALRMKFMEKAAHAFAPQSDGTFTPVLAATGDDNGSGLKRLLFEDVLALENRFDEAEIDDDGRCIILSTQHLTDLRVQDIKLYKEVLKDRMLFGFKLYKLAKKRLPVFDKTNGTKAAFGAAATGNDVRASIAFHKDEVMRAQGTVDMFAKLKDPDERGDILGFQMRGVALPLRGKGIAAMYSPDNA